jgi:dihydroneopterin aldolase
MTYRILVRDLQVFAHHGLLPEEKTLGQRFAIDITAFLDLAEAGRTDDLARSISYVELIETATATLTRDRFDLIEAAAEAVAAALLAGFPAVERVAVELRKPGAPIDAVFAHVGVAIERSRKA